MSSTAVEHLVNGYGFDPSKLAFIPHGAPSRPPGSCSPEARAAARVAVYPEAIRNKTILMNFGLLHRYKGVLHVVRALPQILAKNPNVVFVLVGLHNSGGAVSDYVKQIEEDIVSLHLQQHVFFLGDFLSEEALLQAIIGADVLVTPYAEYTPVSGVLTFAVSLGM
jgi:glycosyltransferase involved in cell wall biosynthesis